MDYEIFCTTLCTGFSESSMTPKRSQRFAACSLTSKPYTNLWVLASVHTLAKKVVLAAFLVVIHQTIYGSRQLYIDLYI